MTVLERWTRRHRDGYPTVTLLAWAALVLHDPIEQAVFGHDHEPLGLLSGPGVMESIGTTHGHGIVGVGHYLGMWGLMIVAMIYPTSTAVFQWYADRHGRGTPTEAISDVTTFAATYTLLWVAVGVVPLAVNVVVPISSLATSGGPLYFGVAFLAVATVQFSPTKRRCPTPVTLFGDREYLDTVTAVRSGWEFGRQDSGSCGAWMGLMVVVGSMNIGWMLLITAAMSMERTTARGQRWADRFGVLSAAVGLGLVGTWFL
ncbi:DUF2182 domain-containing protein [Halorarum salinum]|uniref:DUF2182 domain-containing protein n=1 Tax=Halorarum salinum TaxID=2743089 RepID=A0A7D5Q9R6_9EURY|nr:DUF2182 domain-containing protein [Halobaculum salinum]QLG61896.1 DUF2182 domain-containing protein [Halobaculum salinum]